MVAEKWRIGEGDPLVMGATPVPGGVNYTVRVPSGAAAELVLVDAEGRELFCVDLTSARRFGESTSVRVLGKGVRRCGYFYRIGGRVRRDPYAKRIVGNICYVEETFDKGGQPLAQTLEELSIYRLHVRGFTRDPKSGVREKGTFRGLMRKIPYIRNLGFTAVELLPAYEWDDALREPPLLPNGLLPCPPVREERRNFWGYAKKNYYLAPKQDFVYGKNAVQEVHALVKALHEAGIACIMEFYAPKDVDPAAFLAGLRHWRLFYHVDGFHVVGEGVPGALVLSDPVLADAKLFLEGLSLTEDYPGRRLAAYGTDWMYAMRSYLKSDRGRFHDAMHCLVANGCHVGTVNFMATTEGFTLRDLVSYNEPHNEANGAYKFDGTPFNASWNCGAEGETVDRDVLDLRRRQVKNALSYVFLSQGIPLLCAGDEFGNSQKGNNHAFLMDNPIGWVNWGEAKKNEALTEFVRSLLALRREHPVLHLPRVLRAADYRGYGLPDVSFHSNHVWYVPYDPECRSVGMLLSGAYAERSDGERDEDVFIALNAYWEKHTFEIPEPSLGREWVRVMDTSPEAEGLFACDSDGAMTDQRHLQVPARSVAVLVTRLCSKEKLELRKKALANRQAAERRRVLARIAEGRREADREGGKAHGGENNDGDGGAVGLCRPDGCGRLPHGGGSGQALRG